jgi:hypothetical protein
MARFAGAVSIWMVAMAALLATGGARAQAPCTDAQAAQKPGVLALNRAEQADRDARSRVKPDPVVLTTIDRTIGLLKQSLPDFKGLEGKYWHELYDVSPTSHTFHYSITAAFFDYYCGPSGGDVPDPTFKIRVGDETGTWIYFYFNTLGDLVNERLSLGREMSAANGRTIFRLPAESGEWKGHRLFLPRIQGQTSEAILLTAGDRFPFKPVSRGEFLQAREKVAQGSLEGMGLSPPGAERQSELDELRKLRASMTPSELQRQAVVREWSASPARGKVFVSEAEGGLRLVVVDPAFIDTALPRSAVQLIVVYWRWNEDNPAKREMIRQFKNNFDVAALEKMLGR